MHVCSGACGGQKRTLDPLELQLWADASHQVGSWELNLDLL